MGFNSGFKGLKTLSNESFACKGHRHYIFASVCMKFNILSYKLPLSSRTESIHFFSCRHIIVPSAERRPPQSCQLFQNALNDSRSLAFKTTTVGCLMVQCCTKLALLQK